MHEQRTEHMKERSSQAFCDSLQYWHWPTGGTAQTQRAGAVGGRLNWSRTVLDRAGSMTVMLLLKEGPDTTHTEHWWRGTDMEAWKLPHVTTRSVNYGQMAVWLVMRPEQQRLLCRDGGSGRECRVKGGWWCQTAYRALPWDLGCDCCSTAQLREAGNRKQSEIAPKVSLKKTNQGLAAIAAIYLGRGVSVVQQPELHQNRNLFGIQDGPSRLLQNKTKDLEPYCQCNRVA